MRLPCGCGRFAPLALRQKAEQQPEISNSISVFQVSGLLEEDDESKQ
jgi:hypothetical protein